MQSENLRGALLMVLSMLGFTLSDACMKALGADLPLYQLLALRGALASALIVAIAWRAGALRLRFPARDWRLLGWRSLAEVGETWFFLSALLHMPLANVTALLQLLPLTVTLAGALFLGERLGWRRMSAIGIGFCGMLLIVRPGTEGFNIYTLYALAAVALVTLRDITTRQLSRQVPTLLVTVTAFVSVTLFGAVGSLGIEWQPLTGRHWLLILASAGFLIAAFGGIITAMRMGELGAITPFRYTGLVWALALGWVAFGEWPATLTLVGAAIIAATGVFTLWRERQVG
ncbi:DMT family transporter [Mesobacterium pallidum]|uniref:DMT family transporter n=1 Tax=Mesobacterium pallidum TaxID=2872037 RepID=UPI001EE20F2C|nr:DMT family transporter [Mesobacterium pallidum]